MTDPVDTGALRTQALRNQAADIRADATEAEHDWLDVADSLDAAADEVDRLRAKVKHQRAVNRRNIDAMTREIDRLRAVIENAPHREKCRPHIACTCWKSDAL